MSIVYDMIISHWLCWNGLGSNYNNNKRQQKLQNQALQRRANGSKSTAECTGKKEICEKECKDQQDCIAHCRIKLHCNSPSDESIQHHAAQASTTYRVPDASSSSIVSSSAMTAYQLSLMSFCLVMVSMVVVVVWTIDQNVIFSIFGWVVSLYPPQNVSFACIRQLHCTRYEIVVLEKESSYARNQYNNRMNAAGDCCVAQEWCLKPESPTRRKRIYVDEHIDIHTHAWHINEDCIRRIMIK